MAILTNTYLIFIRFKKTYIGPNIARKDYLGEGWMDIIKNKIMNAD